MADLVVVESPTKVKTIRKILGRGFSVKATVGHIKDLPKNDLGVDLESFSPRYEVIPGKEKVIKEIKASSQKADKVLIATDPDREGEAIAWHVKEEIGDGKECFRVLINEITKKGVEEAIKNPGPLDPNRFSAQKARRVLDRLVGYLISPLLWDKVKRGLSAGRVQSVAVRLICEREREIREFVPEEFWEVYGTFSADGSSFEAKLDGKLKSEKEALSILDKARSARFTVSGVRKKEVKGPLVPPFITSTLQQEAHRRFGFSPKKTMLLAQRLYEGVDIEGKGTIGLITYMRTDSVRLSDEAVARARKIIKNLFGKEFLPARKNVFKNKKSSQDAHEAIRPTIPEITPDELKRKIDPDLHRLYELIWRRFIASQMLPPRYEELTFDVVGDSLVFKARFRRRIFQGYQRLYGEKGEDGRKFPSVEDGMDVTLEDIRHEKKVTEPPKRYTVGTLIRTLEEKGIGRPSTYAAIVSTIQERGYVTLEGGHFKPTFLGEVITNLLVKYFPTIMDVKFTANMEEKLDEVEEGKERWVDMVREFYAVLEKDLERAKKLMENLKRDGLETDLKCRLCGSKMVVRFGKNGPFLLCSRYPECKGRGEIELDEKGDIVFKDSSLGRTCKKCGSPLVERRGRFGRFLACSRYPECKYTEPFPIGFKCPECGADVVEKVTGKGKVFYSCSRYPDCSFSSWYLPVERKCPNCGNGYMVLKVSSKGRKYLQCPKCKKNFPLKSRS